MNNAEKRKTQLRTAIYDTLKAFPCFMSQMNVRELANIFLCVHCNQGDNQFKDLIPKQRTITVHKTATNKYKLIHKSVYN